MNYEELMRAGRARRDASAMAVLHYLWPQLRPRDADEAAGNIPADIPAASWRWSVRGELRTREAFGLPHPADFPGGLPLPLEYPDISGAISGDISRTPSTVAAPATMLGGDERGTQ